MRNWNATLAPNPSRRRKGPILAGDCLIICLACFALLIVESRVPAVQNLRGAGELLKIPVQAAVRLGAGGFSATQGYFRNQAQLLRENEALRTRLLNQDVEMQQMALLRAENEDLRALLALDAMHGSSNLAARALPRNPDLSRHRVTLSIGSRQGAFIGQPVVDSAGVVGQIARDYLVTSEALLISDANHAIPVMFERTGFEAIAFGTGQRDHRLLLPYMPTHADVAEGDVLVSSGSGGRFPAGLRVGVVEGVRNASGQAFVEAFVRPAANLQGVRQVLLLRSEAVVTGSTAAGRDGEES